MAKRRRKRGRSAARRRTHHAAPKHHRRRRRSFSSNPFGIKKLFGGGAKAINYSPKSLIKTTTNAAIDGVSGVAGMGVARFVRGHLPGDSFKAGNTIKGSLAELIVGIGTAPLVAMVAGDGIARAYIQGAFMGPIITAAKSKLAPTNPIAIALGDEGELPLFGGLYDLGGTYDLNGRRTLAAGNGGTNASGLGSEVEVGMM